ncbi:Lipoamide acyltransferase component of branched-chain alpha-keto acid dehydrogenase complex [Acidobacteriia bacterium SbA2]|nr:Lipoamide acyltransferase component of branched-chain alpha-keto acid dehydrogenase complex [Acidobacteriia bacterium SbA2]
MSTNVIMPQMGESVAEGTITKWFRKVGEPIGRDEPLFEISTDKVDAEIPSPAAGILSQILVKENETVAVNTVVAVIDGEGAATSAPAKEVQASAPPATPVAPEPASPAAAEGAEIEAERTSTAPESEEVRSSPLVRRIAREYQVDLTQVRGTGSGGRISKKDILDYVEQRQSAAASRTAAAHPPSVPAPSISTPAAALPSPTAATAQPASAPAAFAGPAQVVQMTPMRRQIAEHMVASKRTSAHVYTVFEVEMTKVVSAREQQRDEFERRNGFKLTYTPFFVRAAVEAIRDIPVINSSIDGTNIIYKRDVNVGIAVALEAGLIVPVIKRADEKNFLGIARAVQDLAERARTKRLSVDDVQGGTFTITNPGSFGGLFGLPIINQPQVAILGVGAIEKRPVVRDDAIAIRFMAYLSLSYDHRVIDGAVAEKFLGRIKQILENWSEPVL